MSKKTFCAVAWSVSSCMFLWIFSLSQVERSDSPSAFELFNSFFLFSVMLLGGGGCYHLLTEIVSSPVDSKNGYLWTKLSWVMGALMAVLISAPLVMILCREYLDIGLGWIVSYLYLLSAISVSLWLFAKAENYFRNIRVCDAK